MVIGLPGLGVGELGIGARDPCRKWRLHRLSEGPLELYFIWGYYGTHYRVRLSPPFGV